MEALLPLIGNSSFDVVHTHDFFLFWIHDYFFRKNNIASVCTIHARAGSQLTLEDSARQHIRINCDRVIAVSNFLKSELIERYGEFPEIAVVENGISIRNDINISKKNKITFCGRLAKTKGVDVLINAFSLILEKAPSSQVALHIIGDGEEKENLIKLCQKNNIVDSVVFHGNIPNELARKHMGEALVHVVPSLYETFGLTAAEALAEGTCVVASDTGGLKEFLMDNENAVLVPSGRHDILSEKIEFLLFNKNGQKLREKLAKNGKKYAEELGWKKVAQKTYDIYQDTIKKNKNSKRVFKVLDI